MSVHVTWPISRILGSLSRRFLIDLPDSFVLWVGRSVMVQLTREQRVFGVLHYTRMQSIAAVQNDFYEQFPERNPPCKTTILRNFYKCSYEGTNLNLNKGNSGRRRTTQTEENIAVVRALLEENPRVGARRNPINISSSNFNRITKLELRWHPYKMHVRHCPNKRCRRRPNFLENLIVGDEAAFAMNGEVYTHNVHRRSVHSQCTSICTNWTSTRIQFRKKCFPSETPYLGCNLRQRCHFGPLFFQW